MAASAFSSHPDCAPAPLLGAAAACSVYVCALGLCSPALRGVGSGSCLAFAFDGCAFRFYVSDPLLGVPDGNDTTNQPTQGPRHYDTLTTKGFYGNLLNDLKDYAAALPVNEEVAEG